MVAKVCRKMGVSEATFYNWKKTYNGLGTAELIRLRQLEEENLQSNRVVADDQKDLTSDFRTIMGELKQPYVIGSYRMSRSDGGSPNTSIDITKKVPLLKWKRTRVKLTDIDKLKTLKSG